VPGTAAVLFEVVSGPVTSDAGAARWWDRDYCLDRAAKFLGGPGQCRLSPFAEIGGAVFEVTGGCLQQQFRGQQVLAAESRGVHRRVYSCLPVRITRPLQPLKQVGNPSQILSQAPSLPSLPGLLGRIGQQRVASVASDGDLCVRESLGDVDDASTSGIDLGHATACHLGKVIQHPSGIPHRILAYPGPGPCRLGVGLPVAGPHGGDRYDPVLIFQQSGQSAEHPGATISAAGVIAQLSQLQNRLGPDPCIQQHIEVSFPSGYSSHHRASLPRTIAS
jgi:hypothetical protein